MPEYCMVFGSDDEKSLFELGMWKACMESDIRIKAIAGAAFGAINAVLLAQGDFEKAIRLWSKASESKVFSDFYDLRRKYSENFTTPENKEILKLIRFIVEENDPVIERIDKLLNDNIDEQIVRASNTEVYITTISSSDFSAVVLPLSEIPAGQLIDTLEFGLLAYLFFYISSDEHEVNILDDAAYKAVSKKSKKILTPRLLNSNTLASKYSENEFLIVENSEYLGFSYTHTFESMKRNIQIGLLDTLKTFKILSGKEYYIDMNASSSLFEWFKKYFCISVTDDINQKIGRLLNIHNTEIQSNILKGVEVLTNLTRYKNNNIFLSTLETCAALLYIERAKRYSPDALINEIIICANNIIQKNYAAIRDEENIFKAMSGKSELPSFTDESSPAINMVYFLCAPVNSNIFMQFINNMKPEMKVAIVALIYLLIY